MAARIHTRQADITTLAVDAIVNAANTSLPAEPSVQEVVFCCFSQRDLAGYRAALEADALRA